MGEAEVIRCAGIDAALYLKILRMGESPAAAACGCKQMSGRVQLTGVCQRPRAGLSTAAGAVAAPTPVHSWAAGAVVPPAGPASCPASSFRLASRLSERGHARSLSAAASRFAAPALVQPGLLSVCRWHWALQRQSGPESRPPRVVSMMAAALLPSVCLDNACCMPTLHVPRCEALQLCRVCLGIASRLNPTRTLPNSSCFFWPDQPTAPRPTPHPAPPHHPLALNFFVATASAPRPPCPLQALSCLWPSP